MHTYKTQLRKILQTFFSVDEINYRSWFDIFRVFLAPEHGENAAFLLGSHVRW